MGIFGISKGKNYFAPEFPGSVNRGMQTIAKGLENFELSPPPIEKNSHFPKFPKKMIANEMIPRIHDSTEGGSTMNRHYIDDGMGNKIDVTTLDGKPFITSADKANAIAKADYAKGGYVKNDSTYIIGEQCSGAFMPRDKAASMYAHDMQVNRNKNYGELVLNIILIAVIIAALVIAYNLGFSK